MENQFHLDIDFYDEHQASVVIQANTKVEDREFGEIVLFNCFALRQMQNLQSFGIPLARILSVVDSSLTSHRSYIELLMNLRTLEELAFYVPLIAALGVDIEWLVPYMIPLKIAKAASGVDDKAIIAEIWPSVTQIVNRRTSPGNKRFFAEMFLTKDKVQFELNLKGFGIFGKGVNYYAPMSVILFLKHLFDQSDDKSYFRHKRHLAKSSNLCGNAFLSGEINPASQLSIPVQLAIESAKYSVIS